MLNKINHVSVLIQDVLASLLIVLLTGTVFLQVLNRLILPFSMPWTEEMAKLILFWLTYIALASTFKNNYHIRIDFIDTILSQGVGKKILNFIVSFMGIIFSIILIYYSYVFFQQAYSSGQKTSVLLLPIWVIIIPVMLGSVFTLLNFISTIFDMKWKTEK